jgi:hypothetical protein
VAVTDMTIRQVRSAALFVLGAAAFIFELLSGGERTTILILAGACMGLPAFLGLDERRNKGDQSGEKD